MGTTVSDRAREASEAETTVREKTDGAACPFCGNDTWLTEADSMDVSTKQPTVAVIFKANFREGPPIAPRTFGALVLSCSNCGFIRMHNVAVALGGSKQA